MGINELRVIQRNAYLAMWDFYKSAVEMARADAKETHCSYCVRLCDIMHVPPQKATQISRAVNLVLSDPDFYEYDPQVVTKIVVMRSEALKQYKLDGRIQPYMSTDDASRVLFLYRQEVRGGV